jgi:glycerol-3-phosphate dehydrogenase (NAD(P)+)
LGQGLGGVLGSSIWSFDLKRLAILGSGAWGTALAQALVQQNAQHQSPQEVTLWSRDERQSALMLQTRENVSHLPGVALSPNLHLSGLALETWLPTQDLIVIATPVSALRSTLERVARINPSAHVAWLCKGFEVGTGLLPHQVQQEAAPGLKAAVLSGPSFAKEVAQGLPCALVAGSPHESLRSLLVDVLHGPQLRIYTSEDWVGVEVGGAVKNVMAIATGLADGLGLGMNARAALITRGLAEISRLALALGAKSETLMGLGGLGDLVLTATGDLSRNRQVGLALARGQSLSDTMADLGHVAEGVYCAETVLARATQLELEMPITQCVVELLKGALTPTDAIKRLMGRQAKLEF